MEESCRRPGWFASERAITAPLTASLESGRVMSGEGASRSIPRKTAECRLRVAI